MRGVTTASCVHCAGAVNEPSVLAWAFGRPVAALCEACVLADAAAAVRRLRNFVQVRFTDYYEDPAIGYSYRGGPTAELIGDFFVSRTA
jgi:hypothetical protein